MARRKKIKKTTLPPDTGTLNATIAIEDGLFNHGDTIRYLQKAFWSSYTFYDVNEDGMLNVNDVTMMVEHILDINQLTDFQITLGDLPTGTYNPSTSGTVDVNDVIRASEIILEGGGMTRSQYNQILLKVKGKGR